MNDEINIEKVKKLTSSQVLNIAFNLRKFRKENNLTQMDTAILLACDKSFVSNLECGVYYKDISLLTLNRLSIVLDMNITDLLNYDC